MAFTLVDEATMTVAQVVGEAPSPPTTPGYEEMISMLMMVLMMGVVMGQMEEV